MKLNKKGFTLVELLAVIVILALLIVVVATTALPAMNNAKKSALNTYAKRVVEQAKTLYSTECLMSNTACGEKTYDLKKIMGDDVDPQYEATLTVTTENGTTKVNGTVEDAKNSLIVNVCGNSVQEDACSTE